MSWLAIGVSAASLLTGVLQASKKPGPQPGQIGGQPGNFYQSRPPPPPISGPPPISTVPGPAGPTGQGTSFEELLARLAALQGGGSGGGLYNT